MNLVRPLPAVLALTLGSCSGPPALKPLPVPPALPQQAAPSPRKPAATAESAPGNPQASPNQEREERGEYRSGFDIGSRDAAYGYPSDPSRAFERFGHDLETPFQDGYADGYARRAPRY